MAESRIKRSSQNLIVSFFYQVVTLVLGFVSRSVFVATLGAEYLGMNSIFSDVLTLLSLADLGFGTAMAYSFYKPLADQDQDRICALIAFYQKVYRVIALAVTVLGLACIPFLKFIVKTEQEIPHLTLYYLISLSSVVISYLFVYKTTLLTADQKDYKVVAFRMAGSLVKTVLQILVLVWIQNYALYMLIGVLVQFLQNYLTTLATEKEYPYIKRLQKNQGVDRELKDGILANMKSVFLYKISGTIFSGTDNILISTILGTALAGVYSNYLMVSNKLLLAVQIIFSALTASIGNLIAKESAKKRYEIFQAMQSVSFIFCGIITTCFFLMASDLVRVWLGSDYLLDTATIWAISLNTYFSSALLPLWVFRDASGIYKKTKYVMLLAAILNIILSIGLGEWIGLCGIIFASAIARISTYFWYEPKLLYQEFFGEKVGPYYRGMFLNLALVVLMILLLSWANHLIQFQVSGWISLCQKGIVIGGICGLVFLLAYCKTAGFQLIVNKAMSIIGKRKKG